MYTEENSASDEEENDDSPRDVFFMALIQDDNPTEGKLSTKGPPTIISKATKEWTYSGIYCPSPKSDVKKKSSSSKEVFKLENFFDNNHSSDEFTQPLQKYGRISYSEEISKSEDEDNFFGVDKEGRLISALKHMKKLRKDNKPLKEQIEMEEEHVNKIMDIHDELKKQMEAKEEELQCAEERSKDL